MKTCSVCGIKDEVIFRCPDGKDRCVVCCAKYEISNEEVSEYMLKGEGNEIRN